MLKINSHIKITLIFSIIVIVVFYGMYTHLRKTLITWAYDQIEEDLRRQTNLTRHYFEEALDSGLTVPEIDRVADDLGTLMGVRISVISPEGTVLGDTEFDDRKLQAMENHLHRHEVQESLTKNLGISKRYSTTLKTDMLYMSAALAPNPKIGFVRLAKPMDSIEAVSSRLNEILVFAVFISLIMAVAVSAMASVYISRPVQRLSQIAARIANGDFSRKFMLFSNDEIGDLARSINDMSEKIKVQIDQVNKGKRQLEAVFLSMFDGVMVLDAQGRIVLINQRLKTLLRIEQDVIGSRTLEVIRNVDVQEMVNHVSSSQGGVQTREMRVYVPEERILIAHASPVIQDAESAGAVLVFHDITELRKLEKVRQDFVANASHELRTPIANIRGYAETLVEGALQDKKNAANFVKVIHTESVRLACLIEDILKLSRIESGRAGFVFTACDLASICRKAMKGLESSARKKSVDLQMQFPEGLPQVKVDGDSIFHVFHNLIENGVKYNHAGGNVRVSAFQDKDCVKVEVSDTGIGIPLEDQSRIFERFYRVDKAHSREQGGTGLGLSIVKHIIQSHQGDISVVSRPGQGSAFVFSLPVFDK